MSNSHHFCTSPKSDVCHIDSLSRDLGHLYLNNDYSDLKLVVEGKEIASHKIVLAARSEYFRALLYGGMREASQDTIRLEGLNLPAFEVLLKYIYCGKIALADFREDQILEILGLANQYGFIELEESISDFLKGILNIRNVCIIYNKATLYHLDSLAEVCCGFVDRHALDILHHDSFLNLSAVALQAMIRRDSFCAQEVDIFRAVVNWAQRNPAEPLDDILSAIRFPLMTYPDLLKVVRPTNLVSPDAILDAIEAKIESKDSDLKYRGYLMPEENVASLKHNTQVLLGEMKHALLDGDVNSYDMERGFTRHTIDECNPQGILVKLGVPAILNHMKLLLWDRDIRSYSYYIEVSVDQKDWVKVIDHSKYLCRSWQNLYFEPRVVKYIRIVGTHNTVNKVFHVVAFECMYTNKPFKLERGLIVPSQNVATSPNCACVIEGVSRSRSALINGDIENYDWDSGYTCHQLGSGAIVIQLAQPYLISSARLLLWDCDDRSYSYYVEVSVDQQVWHMVVDKQEEQCKSWQIVTFPQQPVVFIRIVGTHNTANEVFHCVHFECPAQTQISQDSGGNSTSREVEPFKSKAIDV